MRRRKYLAALSVGFVVGCPSDGDGSGGQSDTPTRTPSPTDTQTSERRDTETATPEPAETETQTDTETPSDTETQTPDPRIEEIGKAIDHIEKGLDRYATAGGLTYRKISSNPPTDRMRNDLYNAREILNDIENDSLPPDQQDRFANARDAYWFVWWLGPTHNALRKAVSAAAVDDWFEINAGQIETRLEAYKSERKKLDKDSTSSGMEVVEQYSPNDYNKLMSRFDRFQKLSKKVIELHKEHITAEERWEWAMREHKNENYQQSSTLFNEAADLYNGNASSYQKPDWADPFSTAASSMTCYAETMTKRAEELAEAAVHGQEGERERRIATEEGAPEPSDECDI